MLEERHRRVRELFGQALTAREQAQLARLLEKITAYVRTYLAEDVTLRKSGRKPASRAPKS